MLVERPDPDAALRLVNVHAHPDDESSKGAATSARYAREGVQVHVVSCTGGERGSVLNPNLELPAGPLDMARMARLRREEMARACAILGVHHHWLGFSDSGFPEGDPPPALPAGCFAEVPLAEATSSLVRLLRRIRPHVVTTYDENGGYPHPDHVRCHEVSVAAFHASGDPSAYPEAGPAWQPLKLYYHHGRNRPKWDALNRAMADAGLTPPFTTWLEGWEPDPAWDARTTTRIPCSEYFETRDQALLAHASQVDPADEEWFGVPRELQAAVWPTEDFELVVSKVDVTLPEDDLFAGVRRSRRSRPPAGTLAV